MCKFFILFSVMLTCYSCVNSSRVSIEREFEFNTNKMADSLVKIYPSFHKFVNNSIEKNTKKLNTHQKNLKNNSFFIFDEVESLIDKKNIITFNRRKTLIIMDGNLMSCVIVSENMDSTWVWKRSINLTRENITELERLYSDLTNWPHSPEIGFCQGDVCSYLQLDSRFCGIDRHINVLGFSCSYFTNNDLRLITFHSFLMELMNFGFLYSASEWDCR